MANLFTKTIFAATLAFGGQIALAQDAPTAETVVATVNGTDITLGHMILLRDGLPEQFRAYPDALLFDPILTQLIEQTLLADSFDGDLPRRAQLSLENETRDLTAAEVVSGVFDTAITDDAVQAAYDAKYTNAELGFEYNASHILVDTAEEALSILEELKGGLDFVAAAMEYSTGPSGPRGGELGWFERGAMVGPFDAAVAEMEVAALAGPVETQFGFHVIRLNDRRAIEAPSLDEVREQIADEVGAAALAALVDQLTASGNVVRNVPEGFDVNALSNTSLLGE